MGESRQMAAGDNRRWDLVIGSGIFWSKLTHGPQISQSYFPALLGMLVPNGYSCCVAQAVDSSRALWFVAGAWALVGAAWNLKQILTDLWPAKMEVASLHRELERR